MAGKFDVGDEVSFGVDEGKFVGKSGIIIDASVTIIDWKTSKPTTQYAIEVTNGDGEVAYFKERLLSLIKSNRDTSLLDWIDNGK